MGNYQSTTGISDEELKIEICLKKNENVIKYTLRDKTQIAKKQITGYTGSSMEFDVDLVTEEMTHTGLNCGLDGDFLSLQESLKSMCDEIRSCCDMEHKPLPLLD